MGDGRHHQVLLSSCVAGASTGDYKKAGIFAKRMGGYNDLAMIWNWK